MEDGVEIINGERFCRRFISERTDPYFLALRRGCEEMEAARQEQARLAAEAERKEKEIPRDPWRLVDVDTYEQTIEPTATGLRIHGLATTPTITSNSGASSSGAMKAKLPVPLLAEHKDHGSQPIGQVYFLRKSSRGVYMRAALFDHFAAKYAEDLIRKGEMQCLSIAHEQGSTLLAEVDGIRFWSDWTLKEISICRAGANPDCSFELYREGDDGRKFWQPSDASKRHEPRLPYRGPWKADQEYLPGDMTSHQGGLWHSEITSKGLRPNESPLGWKLVVKRGAVEKMEKAHAGI
ncbi:hypothetical protein [Mesorhizobium sp. M00.F.Ca.ET.217.01.1.1]|uniref:hypothetical protein n=1 Tax=Mesorhizobium sp. M00.F.Ca.ET.217.01.1.1 TaxID=2500529 RepID=UPI000FDCACAA|nr:hypothetical protein [Mesorhizobium sp. M00.F.Ca.ET.217.01.1.1]TGQ15922.1 hypothetical protein EN860_025555 [Mesorhizobium sp. M00.F.Ca.ET.217.01.1.1]TGV87143.1 hypothetical protein EN801_026495 [Mesorhizobium sp. M00.F.Ca.ET.158.01.1.1]